jgi:uncharacterized cupredoxin-like copper-binding protein
MQHRTVLVALAAYLFCIAASASGAHAGGHGHDAALIGEAGKASEVSRTVKIEMRDTMRFSPSSLSVTQGQTLRFLVKNEGRLKHEFVLGTASDLQAHHAQMKKTPQMAHADDNMLSLAPGQSGELVWKFSKSGVVHLACLEPGHYEAGMQGKIVVAPNSAAAPNGKPSHGGGHALH